MDHLDDMIWSLVHRFCWFLKQFGSALPVSFFTDIEHDINKHLVFFLESSELDECIKSKRDTLIEAVTEAKAKSLALQRGILTDDMSQQK
jgi:hypothetical protein